MFSVNTTTKVKIVERTITNQGNFLPVMNEDSTTVFSIFGKVLWTSRTNQRFVGKIPEIKYEESAKTPMGYTR